MSDKSDNCVDLEVCTITHRDLSRRVDAVEAGHITLDKKFDSHIEKLGIKIEMETLAFATKAIEASRRPGWATLSIVSFLSALSVGLIVKLVGR